MRLELVGQRGDLDDLSGLRPCLDQARRRAEHVQVERDLLLDAGTADLDDHLAAALQQRRMDLGDRSRRDGLWVDPREHVAREVFFDGALDLGERHRRHLIDEAAELLDVDVREQVGPRGEELPELDVRRAELLQRKPKLARALTRGRPVADDTDLAEHAQEPAATRDTSDVQRPASSVRSAHPSGADYAR